jgi:dienelactone hydrolase
VTRDERQGIYVYAWSWDGTHLLYFQDRDGDENTHLWSADLESPAVRDLTPFAGARAQGLFTSPGIPHQVLVGLNVRDPRVFDMYRVDLDTGACSLDTANPGDVLGWSTDAALRIRAACAFDATDGHTTIRVRDASGGPWRDLLTMPFGETPIEGQINGGTLVTGMATDGRTIDVVTYRNSDTTCLVRVDAATGAERSTLAHDPRADIMMGFGADGVARYAVMLDPTSQEVQAVAFEAAKLDWQALDPAVAADFGVLQRAVAPRSFLIIGRDRADAKWIVSAFRADGPTSFFVYDRTSQHLEHLFDDVPELAAYTLAPVEPVHFKARDGLPLVAYLTLPPGVPAKQLPLVLYVHGGPWFRDRWVYDPAVQWLANRGYAVLQVQFRASSGFGKRHLNAGNGQWGVGSMQHDLTDAVRWAVGKGIADPRRVGILGGSYGGYATLAGLAFTPELYACGVDIVGPSNVATLLQSIPSWWAPVKRRWLLRVGDAEADTALAQRISPLYHADAIRAPLLIGHGANDPRVKLAESERIVAALRKRGLPVTFIVYPDEGHGFGRPQNNLDFFGRAACRRSWRDSGGHRIDGVQVAALPEL